MTKATPGSGTTPTTPTTDPTGAALLEGCLRDHRDLQARLVYADYLDENGLAPEADFWRWSVAKGRVPAHNEGWHYLTRGPAWLPGPSGWWAGSSGSTAARARAVTRSSPLLGIATRFTARVLPTKPSWPPGTAGWP